MKLNYYIKLTLVLHFLINCGYLRVFIDASPEIDLTDRITIFDNQIFRIFFHGFRAFWFGLAGKTGYRTRGKFLQEKFPDDAPFPCKIETARSKSIPNSVHRLRPEIKYVFEELCPAPVSKVFFGSSLIFLISCPETFKKILSNNVFSERPYFFDCFQLKYGVITSKFHIWKPTRKAVSPAFSQRAVQSYIPTFGRYFERTCQDLASHVGQETFDVNAIVKKSIIQIIADTTFDMPDETQLKAHSLERLEANISSRILNIYLHPEALFRMSRLYRENEASFVELRGIFRKQVQKRRRELAEGQKSTHLFLDLLLKYVEDEKLEDENVILDNAIIIFGAGYDTATLTISYALLMLAMHPEIDEKVARELREGIGANEEITHENMKNFPYLDMVIKETLRLFPPAPLTIRESTEEVEIENVGTLEKGSIALFNFFKLHRWPQYWGPDAEKFDPEHFSPENSASRHPFAFLPFSGGPRMCLGYQYAMVNIKVGLIAILRRFRFTTDLRLEELQFQWSVTLKLQNKHLVRVFERN